MTTNNTTETSIIVEPNFFIEAALDDKLSSSIRLLSNSQQKLLKTLKDNNEK